MKRSIYLIAALAMTLATSVLASAQSQSQPLGDYARAAKKAKRSTEAKPAAKVYDNDNLPQSTSLSVVGARAEQNPDGTNKQDAQSSDKKNEPALKAGQSAGDRQKALDAWKDKLAGEQEKIGKMSHEIEVVKREYQLKQAEFYANGVERAQNPDGLKRDNDKYQKEIDEKQKQLDDEKTKMSEMQDDARKAGAPSSVTERDSGSEKN